MTRELVFSPEAQADLDDIFDSIAAENPVRALSYVEEIRQACQNLCETPMIGVERSDLQPGLRLLPLWRRIVIAYRLPPGQVDVLRVFSAGRDYEALMRK